MDQDEIPEEQGWKFAPWVRKQYEDPAYSDSLGFPAAGLSGGSSPDPEQAVRTFPVHPAFPKMSFAPARGKKLARGFHAPVSDLASDGP
jgi:hypothetical protein